MALQATTINSAKRLACETGGKLKQVYWQTFLPYQKPPLDHIKAAQDVKFVMKGGIMYKQEQQRLHYKS